MSERPREKANGGRTRNREIPDLTINPPKKAFSQNPQELLEEIRALYSAGQEVDRRIGHRRSRRR